MDRIVPDRGADRDETASQMGFNLHTCRLRLERRLPTYLPDGGLAMAWPGLARRCQRLN